MSQLRDKNFISTSQNCQDHQKQRKSKKLRGALRVLTAMCNVGS